MNPETTTGTKLAANMSAAADTPPVPNPPGTITLDVPIQRGSQTVTHVTVRRPLAGELRGISLAQALQLDVGTLQQLLPRITSPMLTRNEIDQLDPADLMQLGAEVSSFLLTKAERSAFQPT